MVDEAHEDYLEAARLKNLVAETGVRVLELAVLFSAVDAVARGVLLEGSNVPHDELPGIPDPGELLEREGDITTAEAVQILRDFLGMSTEGEARLWRLLSLADEE
jgi:hypothetical protein